jgi:hypothetical protein
MSAMPQRTMIVLWRTLTVNEFKRNKGVLRLFGEEALLEEVIQDYRDVGGCEDLLAQIPKHQNINRSVGSAVLQGFVNIDTSMAMYFEPPREGKVRIPKEMNIRDVLRKLTSRLVGGSTRFLSTVLRTSVNSIKSGSGTSFLTCVSSLPRHFTSYQRTYGILCVGGGGIWGAADAL